MGSVFIALLLSEYTITTALVPLCSAVFYNCVTAEQSALVSDKMTVIHHWVHSVCVTAGRGEMGLLDSRIAKGYS